MLCCELCETENKKIVIHFVLWATEKYFLRTTNKNPTLNVCFFSTRFFFLVHILCSFALSLSFRSNCTSSFFAIPYAFIDGFFSLHVYMHDIIDGASVCLTRMNGLKRNSLMFQLKRRLSHWGVEKRSFLIFLRKGKSCRGRWWFMRFTFRDKG